MKKSGLRTLFFITLAALLVIPAGMALAKELGGMTVSGPGIKGELTLNDPEVMRKLETSGFLETAKIIQAPEGLGEGYILTLFLNMEDGLQPWLQITYYPNNSGENGYFHAIDLMENASKQSVGKWYMVAPKAEASLRELLTNSGVAFTDSEAVTKAESQPSASQPEEQPALSSKAEPASIQPAQPVVVASDPGKLSAESTKTINPGWIWGIAILAALLLGFVSIRWYITQQKLKAVKFLD